MKFQVEFHPIFFIKLEEIETYYRLFESDKRADKVLDSIMNEINRIGENPLQFPKYDKEKTKEIRKAVVHNTFIILFEVIDSRILVFDIYHGKRDVGITNNFN